MALSGNIFTIADPNAETISALHQQLGSLLGVGKRSDGMYHQADFFTANSIKMWARNKPIRHGATGNITEDARADKNYGLYIPAMTWPNIINSTGTADRQWQYLKPRGPQTYGEWYRLRDFDGYNHNPVGLTMRMTYEAVYAGTQAKFYVYMGNVGSTDIPMDKVTISKDTITETKVSLSSMTLCLLISIGSTKYLVNTGKKYTASDLGAATITFDIPSSVKGQTLKVYALLAYTSDYIPSGTTTLSSTTDTIAQVNFISLNLTSSMEAEKSVTIAEYSLLPNLQISYGFTTPIPQGYFQITNMFLRAETGGSKTAEINVEVYVRRYSGASYTVITGGNKTFTGSFSLYSGSTYSFNIGSFTLNKPADNKVGDEVWMRVSVLKLAGSTPAAEYQIVRDNKIHTMTEDDLESLT